MAINNRRMFRQKLNPGGVLVPIVSTAAKQGLKKPLWNMLKFGAMPWALDQAADLMTMDLKTQEPNSTKNPNDETTAKLNLNEKRNLKINSGVAAGRRHFGMLCFCFYFTFLFFI